MYIKIKNFKKFLLVAACILFAGFNYLTYVKADVVGKSCNKAIDADCDGLTDNEETVYGTDSKKADTDGDGYSDGVEIKSGYDPTKPAPGDRLKTLGGGDKSNEISQSSTTESFAADFQAFINSKKDGAVTTSDVDTFVDTQLSEKMGESVNFDNLPEVDKTQFLVLKQDYSGLDEDKKKEKMREDAGEYLTRVTYILMSNAPTAIETSADVETMKKEFENNLKQMSDPNYDGQYFYDLAKKVELSLAQLQTVEVPETMIELHEKFLRLTKGLLVLRDAPSTTGDPMARIATVSKATSFFNLYSSFFQNDLKNYLNQLK